MKRKRTNSTQHHSKKHKGNSDTSHIDDLDSESSELDSPFSFGPLSPSFNDPTPVLSLFSNSLDDEQLDEDLLGEDLMDEEVVEEETLKEEVLDEEVSDMIPEDETLKKEVIEEIVEELDVDETVKKEEVETTKELDPFEFVDPTEISFDATKTKNARASTMINKTNWPKDQKKYAKGLAKGSKRGKYARYNLKGVKNKCQEIHKDLDIEGNDEEQSFNHFSSDLQVRLASRKYVTDKKFEVPKEDRRKTFLDYAKIITEDDVQAIKEVEGLMDQLSDDEEEEMTPEEFVLRATPIIADHPSNGNMGDPDLNGQIQSYTDFHTNSSNQVPRKELEKAKKVMDYGKSQFGDHSTTLFGGLPMKSNKVFSSKVVKDTTQDEQSVEDEEIEQDSKDKKDG